MMKQLPIRGKEKIPQVQKDFLENKQNSFPVRREKGFDIQVPHPRQKSLLCSGQGREQERWKLRGEKRRQMLMTRQRTQRSFQSWRPNLMLYLIHSSCNWELPRLLFLRTFNNRCEPKTLGANAILLYIHRNNCTVTPLKDGKILF